MVRGSPGEGDEVTDLQLQFKRLRSFAATKPVRSPKFLAYVRTLPCVFCDGAAEPHHIFGSFGSLKTSDIFTVPLCRKCHDGIDTDPRRFDLLEAWAQITHEYLRKSLTRESQ